jgi:anti-anti-sigma factor
VQISIADQSDSTARLVLAGKCDIAGADVIALPLSTLAGSKRAVLVDMAGVTFLASIGIRHFVSASKALARRGGRLILLNPTEMVADVLTTSGVSTMMDIVHSESEAAAALKPHMGA